MSLSYNFLGHTRFGTTEWRTGDTGSFAGLAIVSNVVPNETTTWWTTSIFVGFAILSSPIVVDYFMANHQVSDDGLAYRKLVGTRKYLRWSDLRDVRYASLMKWFRLETRSGDELDLLAPNNRMKLTALRAARYPAR